MQSQPDTSPTDLAGNELELSAAEQAALAERDGAATPPATDPAAAAPAAAEGAPAGEEAAAAAGAADATKEQQDAAAAAEAAKPVAQPPHQPPHQPFVATMPVDQRDFAKEMADVKTQLVELRQKHNAGEIDDEAYEAAFDTLQDQKVTIAVAQGNAAQAAQFNQQSQDASWEYLQRQFLSIPENAALQGNPMLFAAWEAAMQVVVNEAAAASRNLTDWDLMSQARAKLAEGGLMGAAAAPVVPATPPAKPDRTPPMKDVPQTLSSVPAGADALGRSTTDQLTDASSIEDVEAYLAGKSDSDRDRILSGVPGGFVDN